MAGGDPRADGQAGVALGVQVIEEDRIAVDRRIVVRRHVEGRDQRLGQHPVQTGGERAGLGRSHGLRSLGQQLKRRRHPHQRAAMGKAVVAQLGHGG